MDFLICWKSSKMSNEIFDAFSNVEDSFAISRKDVVRLFQLNVSFNQGRYKYQIYGVICLWLLFKYHSYPACNMFIVRIETEFLHTFSISFISVICETFSLKRDLDDINIQPTAYYNKTENIFNITHRKI